MAQYLNQLEPYGYIEAFMKAPPVGFTIFKSSMGVPGFSMDFDLLTTMEGSIKKFLKPMQKVLYKPKAIFIGTSVTEYSIFPAGVDAASIVSGVFSDFLKTKALMLVVKDIPYSSPLLSDDENLFAEALKDELRAMGFKILYGQAIAYVPIKAETIDQYLKMFSRRHRESIRRKLRSRKLLSVELLRTGHSAFNDELTDVLYGLYLNTHENSDVQFDRLTRSFFDMIFKDESNNGVVFVYRNGEKIIGFSIGFLYKDVFVDKYVGFLYPDSRQFNLYFVNWFDKVEFCMNNNLRYFISGYTNPGIKAWLGAQFTHSQHAVYFKNPLLRFIVRKLGYLFESDRYLIEKIQK
jgi:predicted N-acyltransferase